MLSLTFSLFYASRADIALPLLIVEVLLALRTLHFIKLVVRPRITVIVAH
jgi:hypothetical protein